MATRRTTFDKLQRERAKRTKAAAKRDRRLDKDAGAAGEDDGGEQTPLHHETQSVAQLLELIEELHRQFEAKELGYEEFEKKKVVLLARLPID